VFHGVSLSVLAGSTRKFLGLGVLLYLLGVTTLRGVVRIEIGAISATWLGEDYKKEI